MAEPGGKWAALRSTIQFADLLQRGAPGPGSDSYLTTGAYSSFELMVRTHGRSPTSSNPLCSMFSDALGLPHGAYLDFPRSREWEVAVGRYRVLFAAFGIQAQDILLRLRNRRLYTGPHVQSYLAGLDGEWEERVTRWTLAVQTAMEEAVELPLFPVEVAHPPRRTRMVRESGPIIRGQINQDRAAPGAAENHQNAGSRDTMPAGQPGPPGTRSEATSTTPGAAMPTASNNVGRGVGRNGQTRLGEIIWESRAAGAGRRVDTSTERNSRPGGSEPPTPAGRVTERGRGSEHNRGEGERGVTKKRKSEGLELVVEGGEEGERGAKEAEGEEPQ